MDSRLVTKCQMCNRTIKVNNMVHPDYGLVEFGPSGECRKKLVIFDACPYCLSKIKRAIRDLTTYEGGNQNDS